MKIFCIAVDFSSSLFLSSSLCLPGSYSLSYCFFLHVSCLFFNLIFFLRFPLRLSLPISFRCCVCLHPAFFLLSLFVSCLRIVLPPSQHLLCLPVWRPGLGNSSCECKLLAWLQQYLRLCHKSCCQTTRLALGQPGSTVFFLFFFVLELFSEGRGATPLLRRSACGAGFFAGPDGGGGGREGSKEARIQGPRERRDSAAGRQTALGESNRAIEGGE